MCGYRTGLAQDNWLFTQHISKSIVSELDNYPTEITIRMLYALQSCRKGCEPLFQLYMYQTNTPQLPSTSGPGLMNRSNYDDWYKLILPAHPSQPFLEDFSVILPPGQTGFYLAVRDNGTCLGISRLRVFRKHCTPYQDHLVLYPDAPAPVRDEAPVEVSCVANAEPISSLTVSCSSEGSWEQAIAMCGCSPGYQVNENGDSCESTFVLEFYFLYIACH